MHFHFLKKNFWLRLRDFKKHMRIKRALCATYTRMRVWCFYEKFRFFNFFSKIRRQVMYFNVFFFEKYRDAQKHPTCMHVPLPPRAEIKPKWRGKKIFFLI